MKNKFLVCSAIFIVGLLAGIRLDLFFNKSYLFGNYHKHVHAEYKEQHEGKGKFTNPLLSCDAAEESLTDLLGVSKFKIDELVDKKISAGEAELVSVYFRDLNNGPWFGRKEKEEFMGGSLLKVPLMISYLKEAESKPGLLDQKIRYGKINPQVSLNQFFQPAKEIKLGNEYTVWELIEYMIKYSDNNAADLLGQNIDPIKIYETFNSLGIGLPDFNKPYPTSVRTYGAFFRVLFNASYLNRELSEKALELLSWADFDKGIRAGVPSEVAVAHKFGIREIGDSIGKQLHNCGIVYYPQHPYVLCVMTRGNDFNKLAGVIADISGEVYGQIKLADVVPTL